MTDLLACVVGGGLLGWLYTRIRDHWLSRPHLHYRARTGEWRRGW
jgi:hypothetical protein